MNYDCVSLICGLLNFGDINKISLLNQHYNGIIESYYKYLYELYFKKNSIELVDNTQSYKYNFTKRINDRTTTLHQSCANIINSDDITNIDFSKYIVPIATTPFKLSNKLFNHTKSKIVNINADKQINKLLPNFDWNNIILAGGAILSVLTNTAINDLDLWIFGDETTVDEKYFYCYNYFSKFHSIKSYKVAPSYIEFQFNDNSPRVQLIYTGRDNTAKDIFGVVNCFDLDPCRGYYDGKNIYCTVSQITSLISGIMTSTADKIYRIFKYTQKGFSISKKQACYSLLKNKFKCTFCGFSYPFSSVCDHTKYWNSEYTMTEKDIKHLKDNANDDIKSSYPQYDDWVTAWNNFPKQKLNNIIYY